MDCSCLWTSRPDDYRRAFSLVPEYLRAGEDVVSLSEYSQVLGRRFRALKLWASWKHLGTSGFARLVEQNDDVAAHLAALDGDRAHTHGALRPPDAGGGDDEVRRAARGVAAVDAGDEVALGLDLGRVGVVAGRERALGGAGARGGGVVHVVALDEEVEAGRERRDLDGDLVVGVVRAPGDRRRGGGTGLLHAGRVGRGDVAERPAPVVHDHGLAENFRELAAEIAHECVGARASGEIADGGDLTLGIGGLRLRADPDATVVTTPADFHRLFPGTGGALYGRASHGWMASFRRPGARTRIPGLYLAGGSVHPGPGVPLSTLSGRLAASKAIADLASTGR